MTVFSRYFGSFDLSERELVHFPWGLPGFEDQTHYAALSIPGQEPILYLQSVTRPEFCLITLPARVFDPAYHFELSPEERDLLQLPPDCVLQIGTGIASQVIITIDRDREPAANLAAPLVINLHTNLGVQICQAGSPYSFRHPLAAIPQLVQC
jgi:flagellar assembly factor FliW